MESVENTFKRPLKQQTVQNEVFIQYLLPNVLGKMTKKILDVVTVVS